MTQIGVLYPWVGDLVLNSINAIIEDFQQKTIQLAGKKHLTAHRDLLPTDSVIGKAKPDDWSTNAIAQATTKVGGITAPTEVKTDQTVLIYGWYADRDLGRHSRFWVLWNDKIRAPVDAKTVYDSPGHFLLTPKNLVWAKETDRVDLNIYNGLPTGQDQEATIFPLGIVYGEAGVLGVD